MGKQNKPELSVALQLPSDLKPGLHKLRIDDVKEVDGQLLIVASVAV